MIEFIVVDVNHNKWKNTDWTNRTVEIEIGYLNISDRDRLRSILINGKTLGIIALEKTVLPIGSKLFANIEACDSRLIIKVVDKPDNWITNIKNSRHNFFSDELFDICWDKNDDADQAGKARLERIKGEVSPHFFYEWIIRSGLDDSYISKEIIDSYFAFRDWLFSVKKSNEFNYGDDEIQQYKIYSNESSKNSDELEKDSFYISAEDAMSF
jgi:hypothetical protein